MLTLEGVELAQGAFRLSADFAVKAGSQVAIIGPSGAGKSTLLAAVAGFLTPVAGRIYWQDTELSGLEPGQRPLSILFQDNNLFPHLTAEQNVGLGLRPTLRLTNDERDRVAQSIDRVGLAGMGDRKPAALSGGQQSRVALARVLLRDKPLMLLDEPFAALGPGLKAEMLDLVAEIARDRGATVLMVTHDPKDAERLARQTILVAEGVAHAPQDTADLLANPPDSLRDYLN